MFRIPLDATTSLVLLEPQHADRLFALVDRNRDHLRPWLGWVDGTTCVEDTRAFIESTRRQWADDLGFCAAIAEADALLGVCGFHAIDRVNRSVSIGYWLAAEAQGRGLMRRAVAALLDIAFASWRLHRVEIRCAVANARSRRVAERLGFREEGIARAAERIGDRFVDVAVYGMVAGEWPPRP